MAKNVWMYCWYRGTGRVKRKAKAIIMSGNVYVDGQKEDKAGSNFPAEAVIEVEAIH